MGVAGRADWRAAASRAWRAVEIAPDDAQVLWMTAFAVWSFDADGRERAQDLFRRSLTMNPNSAMALTLAGWIETMCGNGIEGRAMVEQARHLNPRDPRGWGMSGVMALAAVIDGDDSEAVRRAEDALAQNRRFAVALRVLAVASVRLDRLDRARHVVRELFAIEPQLTIASFLGRIPIPLDHMARARLLRRLRCRRAAFEMRACSTVGSGCPFSRPRIHERPFRSSP